MTTTEQSPYDTYKLQVDDMASRYAAMLGPRCVDIYLTREGALEDVDWASDGWVLEIPTGIEPEECLRANTYEGRPLYYAPW